VSAKEIVEQLGGRTKLADDSIELQEFQPSDTAAVSAVLSVRQNTRPKPFTFEVPPQTVLVAYRIKGSSILTSRKRGASCLIQPGDVYALPSGIYDVVFSKRRSETLFFYADRGAVLGLNLFLGDTQTEIPIRAIDIQADPIGAKILTISDTTAKHSIFRFSSLMLDLLDKLTEPADLSLTRYGVRNLDKIFTKLCRHVCETPSFDWTTEAAANHCGYSVYHFSRTFRAKSGIGFHEFVTKVRAIQAVDQICLAGAVSPKILESAGLSCEQTASKAIQRELGLNLNDIRRFLPPQIDAIAV